MGRTRHNDIIWDPRTFYFCPVNFEGRLLSRGWSSCTRWPPQSQSLHTRTPREPEGGLLRAYHLAFPEVTSANSLSGPIGQDWVT